MPRVLAWRPHVVRALAALLAAVSIVYGSAWLYYFTRLILTPRLGFAAEYSVLGRDVLVHTVQRDSPAEAAGLQPRDRITAIDGRPLDSEEPFEQWQERADQAVTLTVEREGADVPMLLTGQFSATGRTPTLRTLAIRAGLPILGSYPVAFLAVGLTVLIRRPQDPYAWLLALLFDGFVAVPPFTRPFDRLPPELRPLITAYRAAFLSSVPALFYTFFALFPARSPMDRGAPWLKWIGAVCAATLALPGLRLGRPTAPAALVSVLGSPTVTALRLAYTYPWMALGLVSLGWNAATAPTADARRKTRVLLWGTLVGVGPTFARQTVEAFTTFRAPYWLAWTTAALTVVFPVSFAYAVIKHRVLDVPVLLRRSARYVLVRRGFHVLIVALAASTTAVFTLSFSRLFSVDVNVAMAIGVAFGIVLAAGSAPLLRRTTTRIDYAFFRSAYDARAILEELAQSIRRATSRDALAALLQRELHEALHPSSLAIYLESADGLLRPHSMEATDADEAISSRTSWAQSLADRGRPLDAPFGDDAPAPLRRLHAECVVPLTGADGHLTGAIVLGPRLSEESYSGEDKRLLASVAGQASIALDNVQLAEAMADRLDAERAAGRELEIARQVQGRLFPQKRPGLRTLDYAGACVQASRVGGDYYDFLDFGPGRVGLVLADIAGKGISGALLMANLQANLRSQYALALNDLPRLLQSVNRLFYENTEENRFATLFFGDYRDDTRLLRYANCGHFPPLLLRATGAVEALTSTATVLGLFEEWSTPVVDVVLERDDVLIIYTDGVIEAVNSDDEQFGTGRLVDVVRMHRQRSATDVIDAIQTAVQQFAGGAPTDDLTLVVARAI